MPLSQQVIRELRQELSELREQRVSIDSRIQGIQLILGGGNGAPRRMTGEADASTGAPVVRGSLRQRLVDVLRDTPADVVSITKLLEGEGFVVGGATSLRQRVSHELSRLRRLGVVRRRRNRKFVLSDQVPQPAPEAAPAPADVVAV
jgi:hypothetical protein